MASASFALQTAVYAKLIADAGVLAALGGARVYDHQAARSEFPYVTFAQMSARDWSTGTDTGHEHTIVLHVWSRGRGRKDADVILAAIEAALHDQALTLAGHRLINMRHEASEARPDADGETMQGIIRFRAVTEQI
jgi:hypothetical protein